MFVFSKGQTNQQLHTDEMELGDSETLGIYKIYCFTSAAFGMKRFIFTFEETSFIIILFISPKGCLISKIYLVSHMTGFHIIP